MLMGQKEEELNSIIVALRKNYTALQEKLAKEESDKLAAMVSLTKEKDARLSVERSQAPILEELERAQRESSSANQKILSLNDMYKRLQEYNTSLQQYNSKLQAELNQTNEILKNVEKEKSAVLENLSSLRGYCTSLQDQLTATQASNDEALKLKEALVSEVGCLRLDLQQVRDERDRQLSQVQELSAEVLKYKELTGKSADELENLTTKSIELEARCASQSDQIKRLQEKLDAAENKLAMSDLSAYEIRTGVRPLLFDEAANDEPKVFVPESSQDEVFVEVSQLVQSALDGYKVCIFAYGQTGSGKTHTMMGTSENDDDKGLIPRSLEQIFESRQMLQNQGWKYEMQVSMLEIYNETIRDLLTTNRPGSTEARTKQYTIKHDANGNTHVSDMTVVDVRSSREVSFLLNRAAQS
ncbi:hypothetical protein M8C21_012578, partial [Ambrosia artemisiifolia]